MKLWLSLSLLGAVTAYLITRRSDMAKKKPTREERMSTRWRVESCYDRSGDAA